MNRPDCEASTRGRPRRKGKIIPSAPRISNAYPLLSRSPIVFLIAIYIAVVYGCLYLLLTTITEVFQKTYHWSIQISGYLTSVLD